MYWTVCSRHSAWASKRRDHRPRLVERLLVFGGGLRIPDDARARMERRLPFSEHDRANRDIEVHRPGHRYVADRTAVDAARRALELRDDFHGADLRRARDRAARTRGAHEIERIRVLAQHPGDRRAETM